ncbi:unnamed protein product [Pleuronectes platessa]|uniref:Uncharacterized protein n=1 Tax=Pleuronectes platessa TaxID=8262 RepID=A0A9N7U5M4_PLEPL|nr:unnamed protein product [Pleuronectes platessa]
MSSHCRLQEEGPAGTEESISPHTENDHDPSQCIMGGGGDAHLSVSCDVKSFCQSFCLSLLRLSHRRVVGSYRTPPVQDSAQLGSLTGAEAVWGIEPRPPTLQIDL